MNLFLYFPSRALVFSFEGQLPCHGLLPFPVQFQLTHSASVTASKTSIWLPIASANSAHLFQILSKLYSLAYTLYRFDYKISSMDFLYGTLQTFGIFQMLFQFQVKLKRLCFLPQESPLFSLFITTILSKPAAVSTPNQRFCSEKYDHPNFLLTLKLFKAFSCLGFANGYFIKNLIF